MVVIAGWGGCEIMASVSSPSVCEYCPKSSLFPFPSSVAGLPPSRDGVWRWSVWFGCRL